MHIRWGLLVGLSGLVGVGWLPRRGCAGRLAPRANVKSYYRLAGATQGIRSAPVEIKQDGSRTATGLQRTAPSPRRSDQPPPHLDR